MRLRAPASQQAEPLSWKTANGTAQHPLHGFDLDLEFLEPIQDCVADEPSHTDLVPIRFHP